MHVCEYLSKFPQFIRERVRFYVFQFFGPAGESSKVIKQYLYLSTFCQLGKFLHFFF